MRLAAKLLSTLFFSGTLFAQTAPPPAPFPTALKNVVVIFQENRTPDNLFQGLSPQCVPPNLTGCYNIQSSFTNPSGQQVPLAPVGLATNFDLSHSHSNFEFERNNPGVAITPGCSKDVFGCAATTWNQFMFVDNNPVTNSDKSSGHLLDPYLTFAGSYGWANFMYQTNQGPSYPAHQFIFSGTSSINASDDTNAKFVSENFSAASGPNPPPAESGCLTANGASGDILQPTPGGTCTTANGCKCFENNTVMECPQTNTLNGAVGLFCVPPFNPTTLKGHNSMADLLGTAISWKYYAPSAGSIWTAPNAFQEICAPAFDSKGNLFCSGTEWTAHVDVANLGTDILTDIANCHLSNVSWVIPNGTWSDHANSNNGLGPSWVAAVINAIGNSPCTDSNGNTYWKDTAIVVTWDDWGGWFDHVPPVILSPGPPCSTTNCPGDYQYGFRVPMLVVSAYTPQGTINNATHDFGSILRMIEGINGIPEGKLGFADARATTDLRNFFSTTMTARTYTTVPAVKDASFFTGQGQSGVAAVPPDADDD